MDLGADPIFCGGLAGPGAEPAPREEARTRPAGVVILIQALALALVMGETQGIGYSHGFPICFPYASFKIVHVIL